VIDMLSKEAMKVLELIEESKSNLRPGQYPVKQFSRNLLEAVEADPEEGGQRGSDKVVEQAKANPFYKFVMKEAQLSDVSQALGMVHSTVINAAVPALIGREMIAVLPTTKPLVRFILAKKGKAWRVGETRPWSTGEKYSKQDCNIDVEWAASEEWSQSFLEDTSWPVLQRQVAEIGRAIGEEETTDIYNLYNGIAAGSLAGGAIQTTGDGASFAWADCVKLWTILEQANFHGKVLALNPAELEGVFTDEKFLSAMYFGNLIDITRGILGTSYLGFKVVWSTLITSGTKLMIDTDYAAALCLRRDILTKPYEDTKELLYGAIGSERYGLTTLRTTAVAKGT